MRSELITDRHLARCAVIYVRQSSPHQVLTNPESLRLQYDLRQRALGLGWRDEDVEVIDADLGLSGAAATHREGFKELIARVTLGQVGVVLSSEVTRLTRNCSDWYPLLDLCGYRDCLIADRDGVYDPGTANGRLLLGLKGTISEVELHTIRARLTTGLLNKAARGDLALILPAGLVREAGGVVVKNPDREVQARLDLIFATFLRVRSASKVLRALNERGLSIPRRGRFGDTVWRSPTVPAILAVLKNPAYAGAFVYGRSRSVRTSLTARAAQKTLPREQWRVVVRDKYPAYISWEIFEKIQDMLHDNYAEYSRNKTRGVPREGAALLHGIVYCGACGHKMVVQYKSGSRYICNYFRQQSGVPVCQYIQTNPVDAEAVAAFFKALAPAELEVFAQAVAVRHAAEEAALKAQAQQVERLRYRAALAERQFDQVDPDNRLVAAELERRWEETLRDLRQAEASLAAGQDASRVVPFVVGPDLQAAFAEVGRRLPDLWHQPTLTTARKKAPLRCLIDKVVIHRAARDMVAMRIVWRGGATSEAKVPLTVGSLADLSRSREMEADIIARAPRGRERSSDRRRADRRRAPLAPAQRGVAEHGASHPATAWDPEQALPVASAPHPRCLTVSQLTVRLGVTKHWIYDRIHNGTIAITPDAHTGLYLFPDGPRTLSAFRKLKAGKLERLAFDPRSAC